MRTAAALTLAVLLSTPVLCADVVITKSKTTDAGKPAAPDQAPKPTTETTWIGKDRMRTEEGDTVTIVRADLKKMYMLDMKAKTATTVDLPVDMKKYMPPEMAPMMEQMFSQIKVTVTPTAETKQIKDWKATKYTLTMTMPMGGSSAQEMWVTKDVKLDYAVFNDLSSSMMSASMGGGSIANEYKKIDGFALVTEHTMMVMGKAIKSREEVVSVETKDAPEGSYDVPKGFTEKPFDPMANSPMGGRGAGGKPGGPPPEKK